MARHSAGGLRRPWAFDASPVGQGGERRHRQVIDGVPRSLLGNQSTRDTVLVAASGKIAVEAGPGSQRQRDVRLAKHAERTGPESQVERLAS
jgi:hypothetical protein